MKKLTLLTTALTITAGMALAQTPDLLGAITYPTGGSSSLAVTGDFNGDGLPDVITFEAATQSLSVLLGKADGSLQAPAPRGLGFFVSAMAVADFNGDGRPDLAMATGSSVVILLNTGGGAFGPAAFYGAGITANYVASADFNHDGNADLAVAGGNGFSVLRGMGTGAFTLSSVMPQLAASHYLILGDFNRDGNIDILGDNGGSGAFFAGQGDMTFAAPILTVAIPYGTVAADFNGDGILDLAKTVAQQRQNFSVQAVELATGLGTGQFQPYFDMVLTGAAIGQPVAGDFNGDGRMDVAVWRGSSPGLLVMFGVGDGTLKVPVAFNPGATLAGTLIAADLDGNKSADVLLLGSTSISVYRNVHGNPPLLSQISVTPTSVIGGGTLAQGMVTLGGPAPAGGAIVTLASDNTALAFPTSPTVMVPAGTSSASFTVSTSSVITPTTVNISGSWNSVTQSAALQIVAPYSLSSLRINPASQYGIFTAQGTVTLSGPSDGSAIVALTSANPALASVPASVTVPAGASSVTFSITLQSVTTDTAVAISASMGGSTQSAAITVLKPADAVQITRADYTVKSAQLRLDVNSTSATATLTAYNANTGVLLGTLSNAGNGKYNGSFLAGSITSVTIKSSFGGSTTGPVAQK